MKVVASLRVNCGSLNTCGGQLRDQRVGIGHHEVSIQGHGGNPSQRRNHRWTEGQIRYKVTIHQIEVEEIGTGRLNIGDLSLESGEIGRQQRWGETEFHRLTHTEMMSDRDSGEPAGGYCRSTIPEDSPG